MKQYLILMLFMLLAIAKSFSQGVLQEFVINKDDSPQAFYKSIGCTPDDGVIVFNTVIRNLRFSMPDTPNRLKNVPYFNENDNFYVLCVQPTDGVIGGINKYSIDITATGYKKITIDVTEVIATKIQAFEIYTKILPIPPSQRIKIIAGIGNGITSGKGMGFYGELRRNFSNNSGLGIIGGAGSIDGSLFDHWSAGTIMHWRCFFVSGHYGTVTTKEIPFSSNNSGSFTLPGEKILYGISALTGYDYVLGKWFHVTAGIGGSYCFDDNPKFMFAWNVGIGISFIDFFK